MCNIFIYSISILFLLIIAIIYIKKRKKRNIYKEELNPDQMDQWKRERREKKRPITLDVKSMGENVEKSHDLWKRLAIILHESKWMNASQEKKDLAEELNMLINQHKNSFKELKNIEKKINQELLE